MVSRQTTRPLRKLVPAAALGFSALLGVVGCSAGQVAQTAEMEPAVNGNTGQVGNMYLRDVQVAFPENGEAYRAGEDAPLVLTIVNRGSSADELVGVTSPAGKVEIVGNANLPGRTAIEVVVPGDNPAASSATSSAAPTTTTGESGSVGAEAPGTQTAEPSETSGSSAATTTGTPSATQGGEEAPDLIGTISLVITGLTGDLPFGKNVPVTFEFAQAGKITVQLPVAAPATAREEGRDAPEGEAEEH